MRHLALRLYNTDTLPLTIYSEIDEEDYEVRKIELFQNGSVGYAEDNTEVRGTRLGDQPVPPTKEINLMKDFHANEITKEEFECLWRKYVISYTEEE